MKDYMRPLTFEEHLNWILEEYRTRGSIYGIPKAMFFKPDAGSPMVSRLFGDKLHTPIGPAAGPHTQLVQNIVSAWLCGARYMELKTVQIMDELVIERPCIDMEDEGYNVEWSQELKLERSAAEYARAWVLVHLLPRLLGWDDITDGTIFNMSVGYNMEGILQPRMQQFMASMEDASEEISKCLKILKEYLPEMGDLEVPSRISAGCTLSTMHGCPPDEIEKIASYLINRGLHVFVKLNPTLLGAETVRSILNDSLGFKRLHIPDSAFEHDLKYPQAVEILRNLSDLARRKGVTFGVKLTNTLAMENWKGRMPGGEMYMSGRPLFPLAVNLFNKIRKDFPDLPVSFSAGVDQENVDRLFACGVKTVTIASEILKPGGYGRLASCVRSLERALRERGCSSLEEFAKDAPMALEDLARGSLADPKYRYVEVVPPKSPSPLGMFDCVEAPCSAACPVNQEVPMYARRIAKGDFDGALEAVLRRNPMPGVTGHVCPHGCQDRCTRNQIDEPVAIRALKRAAERYGNALLKAPEPNGVKVAVIGAGPSGIAAAAELAMMGFNVTVFEASDRPGGMMGLAPSFRLPKDALMKDLERVKALGVEFLFNHPVKGSPESLLGEFQGVYVATGFPVDSPLGIPGEDAEGVFGALKFLDRVSRGERPSVGERVLVIGGGNTAMDAARTAMRLGASVKVVYRRTKDQMPAEAEEIEAFLAEGGAILELASPEEIIVEGGVVKGLLCRRNRLGEPGPDGRPRPVATDETFRLDCDSVIAAIGQSQGNVIFDCSSLDLSDGKVKVRPSYLTSVPGVYAGGDLVRGPKTVIAACADGRSAARSMALALGVPVNGEVPQELLTEDEIEEMKLRRSVKVRSHREARREGRDFDLFELPLSREEAVEEARRCLSCDVVCDKCVDVCPNRANVSVRVVPSEALVPVFRCDGDRVAEAPARYVAIRQDRQIVHVEDLCNRCGNCETFCVHQDGKPYEAKPRLFLGQDGMVKEEDNAVAAGEGVIVWKDGGIRCTLERTFSGWCYEDPFIRVELTQAFRPVKVAAKSFFEGERSLELAFKMKVLLEGMEESGSYLLVNGDSAL
ncbi:putative selenate reductase, YgfK subunit [Thermanaerovibrio velox DSM 12556]|uniref:Putative selenate reductase, YgfK subunit n=1 Tax=Thermanaerovibrio velox DSM 12556 TaxID=926567 RepID=H0UP01_9BACT|nr:putative selenate reductase subunit YgfK [Thermanaerovibrio velox]EHM10504.1 putative selenate reductase, YgfK subunit [Thermanaerovibrio velox DSM 12556]